MSSVGRNANRFNGIRSALQSATTASATTQEQIKAVAMTSADQQKAVNKRVEDLENVIHVLKADIQTLKSELTQVKATVTSAASSASASSSSASSTR